MSIHFSKYIKKAFSHHKDQEPSTKSAPASLYSESNNSSFVMAPGGCYSRDPMRCGNHTPDIVGYYYDPMSCQHGSDHGFDATNTGA